MTNGEAMESLADEVILFRLSSPDDGVRGAYTVPYGPGIPAADAEVVRRLSRPRSGG